MCICQPNVGPEPLENGADDSVPPRQSLCASCAVSTRHTQLHYSTLSPGFSYWSTPSPIARILDTHLVFQRSQLGFQSQVYLHLVSLYDKQITIKRRLSAIKSSWKPVELLGSIHLLQSQESSTDLTASLLAQGFTML